MPISFEPTENTIAARDFYRTMASEQMRPVSRASTTKKSTHCRRSGSTTTGTTVDADRRGAAKATASFASACRPRSSAGATPHSTCACRRRRWAARPSRRRARTSRRTKVPRAVQRGRPAGVGRDGDHRTAGRFRRGRNSNDRGTRRRRVGAQRHKIFCTGRRRCVPARGRLRGGLGHGGSRRRTRGHQVVRGAGRHAGHEARSAWRRSSASAPRTRRPCSSRTVACRAKTCWAAPR